VVNLGNGADVLGEDFFKKSSSLKKGFAPHPCKRVERWGVEESKLTKN
jgi:hypothetical protein